MDEQSADALATELEALPVEPEAPRINPPLIAWIVRRMKGGVRLEVVQTVADLPASAGPREWFRVAQGTAAERRAVYVGNGQGQPLTKLDTAAL